MLIWQTFKQKHPTVEKDNSLLELCESKNVYGKVFDKVKNNLTKHDVNKGKLN